MLTFWIIAVIFILMALAFVVPPFLKTSVTEDPERNRLNLAIYKERVAELEQEQLTMEQREVAKQELDRTLLQDLGDNPLPLSQPRARWASVVVTLSLPIIAVGSYLYLGSPQFLQPLSPSQADNSVTPNSPVPPDFQKMVEKLVARLEKQPDDEKGWQMLARSYAFLNDYKPAIQTYNQTLAKFGDNPEVLTDLAEFMAKSNNDELAGLPTIFLKAALSVNPNYQDALWLAGFSAAQKQDFQSAIDYWQRFLKQVPETEVELRQSLEKHIAEARHQMAGGSASPSVKVSPETSNSPPPETVTGTPATNSAIPGNTSSTETNTLIDAKIAVNVSLDPSLQEKVSPENTLFIYARATQGPPMPLAIVKQTAKDLPANVTLDDSLALTPALKLSNFKEVVVLARISSSGQATPQHGDLLGQSDTVVIGKQTQVTITINQVMQ